MDASGWLNLRLLWQVLQDLLPMAKASLSVAALATTIALPVATGLILAMELAPPWLVRLITKILDLFLTVPSIVWGLIGSHCLLPIVRSSPLQLGYSILMGGIVLSFLVLPQTVELLRIQLNKIKDEVQDRFASIGLTSTQSLLWVYLPRLQGSAINAFILGFARALADTMVVLLVVGNIQEYTHILAPSRTLSAHIVILTSQDLSQTWAYESMAVCFLLVGSVFLFRFVIVAFVKKRMSDAH